MKIHLSMSIEGLEKELKSFGNKEDGIEERNQYCLDMFNKEYNIVMQDIKELKKQGWKYISAQDCDNINEDGSCGGHLS